MTETSSGTRHLWRYAALLLVAGAIISAQVVAFNYYQSQYFVSPSSNRGSGTGTSGTEGPNSPQGTPRYLEIKTLINYGNGTSKWYNETNIPVGWNFYNLTASIAKITSEYYPDLNEHQILSINGLEQDSSNYWSLWTFCQSGPAWVYSSVGADDLHLASREVFAWYFTPMNSNAPPVSGARTTLSCSA
jgi:Domain of unknown function (DUF4430)